VWIRIFSSHSKVYLQDDVSIDSYELETMLQLYSGLSSTVLDVELISVYIIPSSRKSSVQERVVLTPCSNNYFLTEPCLSATICMVCIVMHFQVCSFTNNVKFLVFVFHHVIAPITYFH
jgi:hypothetical protein